MKTFGGKSGELRSEFLIDFSLIHKYSPMPVIVKHSFKMWSVIEEEHSLGSQRYLQVPQTIICWLIKYHFHFLSSSMTDFIFSHACDKIFESTVKVEICETFTGAWNY